MHENFDVEFFKVMRAYLYHSVPDPDPDPPDPHVFGPPIHSINVHLWRTASLRSAPHQQTPDPVYIVVDKLVHCDPNMYS